ncbi:MAG: DUF5071 domain-containing protein [Lachnospiraceae bacterium]|nr:DUF5071 domain-containing protein [Lachnospiraceae bacterium]
MKQVKNLVPKNKFDFSGMEELMKLSDEEIEPVIPDLLAWMKDMNWPVAKEMSALLALHQESLIPHIIEILQTVQCECDWKTNIIYDLLPLLDEKYLLMLKPALERIMKNPTEGELDEGTNIQAENILKR